MYAHFTTLAIALAIADSGTIESGDSSIWGFEVGRKHQPCDIPLDRLGEEGVCVVFECDIEPSDVDEWSALWSWLDHEGSLPVRNVEIFGRQAGFDLLGFSCCGDCDRGMRR